VKRGFVGLLLIMMVIAVLTSSAFADPKWPLPTSYSGPNF
jgi:hypothetical protein